MAVFDMFRLEGKAALVTGGSKGLGRAMAQALAEAGADVAICSRHLDESQTAAAEIAEATGRRAFGFEADVTDKASVTRLAQACTDALGKVDILINNAGINIRKLTPAMAEEEWDAVVDISLKGSFLCTQALMPAMMERGWGRIVLLGSTISYVSIPGRAPYSSAKAGMLGLTRTLALEGAQRGVNVNCLCPGAFATPMNQVLINDPVANEAFLAKVPLGRWGQPEELGGVIVFLCSSASSYMTGTSLVVDGGWIAQ
jgi:NAD(P)-dependent dehydrogenase (short-subunit alcohol dehydrogenase family)